MAELFGPLADDILLLEVDSTPLLTNALEAVKNACGTSWQLDRSDPGHDCSLTPLGRSFEGPDGTWQTSAEYNLVRLLTMTPANSVVDDTSIEQMRSIADFLDLGGGFSTILAESMDIDRTEEFLTTPEVVRSLQRNLLESHPEIAFGGSLPITLGDALGDLGPMATRFGPTAGHPGVLDPSAPVFGEVFTEDFRMHTVARSNLRVVDGVDLSVGKDFMAVIVDTEGPTLDDEVEFDFTDPDDFSITGIAQAPTVDLRFGIQEHPTFVRSCTGGSCQDNLPGNPTPGFVWDIEPWRLEYIVADAGRQKYGSLSNTVSYYVLGFIWAATVDVGRGSDPGGWASFSVLLDIGDPPEDQYVWDLINEIAQVGIHDSPPPPLPRATPTPPSPCRTSTSGSWAARSRTPSARTCRSSPSEISGYILGNYKENSGPLRLLLPPGPRREPRPVLDHPRGTSRRRSLRLGDHGLLRRRGPHRLGLGGRPLGRADRRHRALRRRRGRRHLPGARHRRHRRGAHRAGAAAMRPVALLALAACVEPLTLEPGENPNALQPGETRTIELRMLRLDVEGYEQTVGLDELKSLPVAPSRTSSSSTSSSPRWSATPCSSSATCPSTRPSSSPRPPRTCARCCARPPTT